MLKKLFLIFPLVISTSIFAQEAEDAASDVEEVVVVGSQIKGAKITGALPVSVISSEDIEALGIDSGDELLDNIAELGQNTFNQNEFSGGYNASRGDVGAFNLRDIFKNDAKNSKLSKMMPKLTTCQHTFRKNI